MFEGIAIGDVGFIAPGKPVLKAGRTTEITEGVVNDYGVQMWSDGKEMKEIVVIGVDPTFACHRGNGAFLAVEEVSDGTRRSHREELLERLGLRHASPNHHCGCRASI